MASSTSSERAFSSAGITISKRRNRLKADIVEALQYLKSCIHHSLLFRESPSSVVECRVYGADLDPNTKQLYTVCELLDGSDLFGACFEESDVRTIMK